MIVINYFIYSFHIFIYLTWTVFIIYKYNNDSRDLFILNNIENNYLTENKYFVDNLSNV